MSDKVGTEGPEFVGGRPRTKVVELVDHVSYKGKVYTSLTVRRLTAREVSEWMDKVRAGDGKAPLGNVVDDEGKVVDAELLESLDDDDDYALSEVIADFLPRRLSRASDSDSETQT